DHPRRDRRRRRRPRGDRRLDARRARGRRVSPRLAELAVGDQVASRTIEVDRTRLVRYAGASGDFNPIHWNERCADDVGLGVVVDWLGDPGAVLDYQTRFARPVPVPDPGAASVEVTATVGALDAATGTARIDLLVVVAGQRVLAKAQVLVRLEA